MFAFFFAGLSLSRTRFPEMRQSPLGSHRPIKMIIIIIITGSIQKKNIYTNLLSSREEKWTFHSLLVLDDVVLSFVFFLSPLLYLMKFPRNVASIRVQSIYRQRLKDRECEQNKKRKEKNEMKWKKRRSAIMMKKVIKMCACLR